MKITIRVLGFIGLVVLVLSAVLVLLRPMLSSPIGPFVAWLAAPLLVCLLGLARSCGVNFGAFSSSLKVAFAAVVMLPCFYAIFAALGGIDEVKESTGLLKPLLSWLVIAIAIASLAATGWLLAYVNRSRSEEPRSGSNRSVATRFGLAAAILVGAIACLTLLPPAWRSVQDNVMIHRAFHAMTTNEEHLSQDRDSLDNHLNEGRKLMASEQWNEAKSEFLRGLRSANESDSSTLFRLIGVCYIGTDELGLAAACSRKSLGIARHIRSALLVAYALDLTDYVRRRLDEADMVRELALELGRKNGLWSAYVDFAGLNERLGQYYAKRSEQSNGESKIGDSGTFGLSLHYAKCYYRHALEIRSALGDSFGMARDFGWLGKIYEIAPRPDSSLEFHRRALEISEVRGYENLELKELLALGHIWISYPLPETALGYFRRALEIQNANGYRLGVASVLRDLATVFELSGDTSEALASLIEASRIFSSVDSVEQARLVEYHSSRICQVIGWSRFLLVCEQNGLTLEEARRIVDLAGVTELDDTLLR